MVRKIFTVIIFSCLLSCVPQALFSHGQHDKELGQTFLVQKREACDDQVVQDRAKVTVEPAPHDDYYTRLTETLTSLWTLCSSCDREGLRQIFCHTLESLIIRLSKVHDAGIDEEYCHFYKTLCARSSYLCSLIEHAVSLRMFHFKLLKEVLVDIDALVSMNLALKGLAEDFDEAWSVKADQAINEHAPSMTYKDRVQEQYHRFRVSLLAIHSVSKVGAGIATVSSMIVSSLLYRFFTSSDESPDETSYGLNSVPLVSKDTNSEHRKADTIVHDILRTTFNFNDTSSTEEQSGFEEEKKNRSDMHTTTSDHSGEREETGDFLSQIRSFNQNSLKKTETQESYKGKEREIMNKFEDAVHEKLASIEELCQSVGQIKKPDGQDEEPLLGSIIFAHSDTYDFDLTTAVAILTRAAQYGLKDKDEYKVLSDHLSALSKNDECNLDSDLVGDLVQKVLEERVFIEELVDKADRLLTTGRAFSSTNAYKNIATYLENIKQTQIQRNVPSCQGGELRVVTEWDHAQPERIQGLRVQVEILLKVLDENYTPYVDRYKNIERYLKASDQNKREFNNSFDQHNDEEGENEIKRLDTLYNSFQKNALDAHVKNDFIAHLTKCENIIKQLKEA